MIGGPTRRDLVQGLVLGAGAALTASVAVAQTRGAANSAATNSLTLGGKQVQGGFVIGRTTPRALIFVDGEALTSASSRGLFVVGFDRDAKPATQIEGRIGAGASAPTAFGRRTLNIAPGTFPSSAINGLPPTTVEPSDPALLARIREEAALKAEGFASRIDGDDFATGFVWPLESYRISSAWGSQRVLNGTPARPHYGIDLAAPAGSIIRAPAAGTVVFSRPGMHFEGGLVLIDHGQGLISCYLHQSRIDVAKGQKLQRGEVIGRVGMTGRATGPHLCWRMKWRDRNLDPSLMVGPPVI